MLATPHVRLNNGNDGGGDWFFNKNGHFYSPQALHAAGATYQEDGNIHGPVWGGHLSGWIEKRIHESSAFWVDGNNWWRKDFRAGIEFITQGGFVEGDRNTHRRVNLHANVPHRLLYVSITTIDFGQPDATWNHQVKDLSNERDGFEWFHGWQERKMYWMAVGY